MATISECRYRWLRESSKAERAGEVWVGSGLKIKIGWFCAKSGSITLRTWPRLAPSEAPMLRAWAKENAIPDAGHFALDSELLKVLPACEAFLDAPAARLALATTAIRYQPGAAR
jgi:hypothetical protein